MQVTERRAGDVEQLHQCIRREKDAHQRDRYRAVWLAIQGHPTKVIINTLSRSRSFVQRWAYVYRDHGVAAICVGKPPGAPTKLTPQDEQQFKARMLAGPTEADGVCTLRGRDAQRILEQEFAVAYSLPGVYDLLHRLGLSCLKPRPRHRKNDPQAMQQWLEDAPLLSSASRTHTPTSKSKSGSKTKHASASRER